MTPIRLAVTVALVAGLVLSASWFYSETRLAPDTSFTLIDGKRMDSRQLRGAPALVTFWATTCPPCIEELPDLKRLHQEFAPRGFNLIAVAVQSDPPAQVLALKEREHLPYPIALDLDGRLAEAFGVQVIPRSFLIDARGRVVLTYTGAVQAETVRAQILSLLEKQQ